MRNCAINEFYLCSCFYIFAVASTDDKIVVALFSYDAESKKELTFRKGEKLVILDE